MARIKYTKTYFNPPQKISEELYNNINSELKLNSNYVIDPNPITFSEHFSSNIKTIGISLFLAVLCFGIFEDGNPMIGVGGISMIIFISSLIHLFLEGPSFATYIKQKEEYFTRMKYAIQNTNTYVDFVAAFY